MKLILTILFLLIFGWTFSQNENNETISDSLFTKKIEPEIIPDSLLRTQIFSLSPLKKTTKKVNGLVLGVGYFDKNLAHVQKVNGVNIDINPLAPFVLMFYDPSKNIKTSFSDQKVSYIHNGLNISACGYWNGVIFNGVSLALFNVGEKATGLSIHGLFNHVHTLNGLHITSLYNIAEIVNGVHVSIFNKVQYMNGLQVGLINHSNQVRGIQIGLFNTSKKVKGVQIGFWNINEKRSLPFINF